MPCALGICNQSDCLCGTVINRFVCPEHKNFLVVEAVPFYDAKLKEQQKRLARVNRWWYVLACPVRHCTYAKPWKNGPRNNKRPK